MKVQPVTKSKYAEMRGCAASAVTKAIQEGRISTLMVDGREMIDPEVADIQWQRNTRSRVDSTSATAAAALPAVIVANEVGGMTSYDEARRRRETAEANIAEMKQAEMEKTLIRADSVRAAWASIIASTRDAILQIPIRVGALVAAESDPVRATEIIETELRQVLEQLSSQE